ncbi:MAG: type II secretion system secretin GspD [Nitrospinota bacterium]|nr:type II secretion system secretin GspD [Nitrospinota bacterium]
MRSTTRPAALLLFIFLLSLPGARSLSYADENPLWVAENISVSGAKTEPVDLRKSDTPLPGPKISVNSSAASDAPLNESRKSGLDVNGEKASRRGTDNGPKMSLNFESAPIREVIKNICEFLGMNYIIEDDVKGFVTIRTLDRIPSAGAADLLDQLLVINNLTRVKVGDYWRFLPLAKAMQEPLPVYQDPPASEFAAADRFQIQILTFNYVSAAQVLEIMKPFLSKTASASLLARSNMLILVERGIKLVEIMDLVKALDVDSLDTMQVKLFPVQNAYSADVTAELVSIYTAMGYINKTAGTGITFLSLDRMNAILMINPFPKLYPTIQEWVAKLDSGPVETEELSTFIYDVQNGNAENLTSILNQIYSMDENGSASAPADPKGATAVKEDTGRRFKAEIANSSLSGSLQIISHKDTNTIIIRTARKNYPMILETLKRLDSKAQQVLIEVLITELTLSDDLQFGLEWAIRSANGKDFMALNAGGLGERGSVGSNLNTTFNPAGGSGLSFFTRPSANAMGLLHALASQSKLEVRASPMLMTSDNKPASIDITSEVPISTTSFSSTGAEVQNIQYRSVGIRLSLTPKINEDKYVALEIDQEISQIDDTRKGPNNESYFFRRQAKTSVMVKDAQSVMIGGMINNTKGGGRSGIPILSKIPIIGWLFGATDKKEEKTELLILLTPHVVENDEQAEVLTEDYKKKIMSLQSNARKTRKSTEENDNGKNAPKDGVTGEGPEKNAM